jgi:outer membrane protein OmpA-like peptidoglycan-associated protein
VELKAKADDPGTKPLNKALSEKRGQGIRDILVAAGLPASAIAITSLGNEQPTFPPLTPDAAETLNRRVEVLLHFKP